MIRNNLWMFSTSEEVFHWYIIQNLPCERLQGVILLPQTLMFLPDMFSIYCDLVSIWIPTFIWEFTVLSHQTRESRDTIFLDCIRKLA